jgi:hypothetical protein
MKPTDEDPYWKAIRAGKESQILRRDIDEIKWSSPRYARIISAAEAFYQWLNGKYKGSPWPVLYGFLVLARWNPKGLVKDILRASREWIKVCIRHIHTLWRIIIRAFPIVIRGPHVLVNMLTLVNVLKEYHQERAAARKGTLLDGFEEEAETQAVTIPLEDGKV